jgi:hypothetical protein
VQNYGIIPDFDLFLHGKNGGPSPRVMDRARVGGPRWTRDRDRVARSPERVAGAVEPGGSPRVEENGEELRGC